MTGLLVVFLVGFLGVGGIQNPYCALSCSFGVKPTLHTVCERNLEKCGPGPKCGPDFKVLEMNDPVRQYLLDLHNDYRNKVASGRENRDRQPSAANMNVLTYDKELEFVAQCWANTCNGDPLDHDFCRSTKKFWHVGQNLAIINSTTDNVNLKKFVKHMVSLWYEEVAIFRSKWVRDTRDRGASVKVGHYTQLLWAETTSVGCALSYYTNYISGRKTHNYLLVCNYGPGGNFIGLPVYEAGPPCSKCPEGTTCNDKFRALCGKTVRASQVPNFTPYFDI